MLANRTSLEIWKYKRFMSTGPPSANEDRWMFDKYFCFVLEWTTVHCIRLLWKSKWKQLSCLEDIQLNNTFLHWVFSPSLLHSLCPGFHLLSEVTFWNRLASQELWLRFYFQGGPWAEEHLMRNLGCAFP